MSIFRLAAVDLLVLLGLSLAKAQGGASVPMQLYVQSGPPARHETVGGAASFSPESDVLHDAERKSMGISVGLSMIVPGAGQIYNGEVVKGVTFFGLFSGGVLLVDAAAITKSHRSITAFGWLSIVYLGTVYVWNLLDAPLSAKRINLGPDARNNEELFGIRGEGRPGARNLFADPIFRVQIAL